MAKFHVVRNPRSGTAAKVEEVVREVFADNPGSIRFHNATGDPADAARRALRDDECVVIVAAGGDGTVSAVAAVCIEYGKTLGVLPAGTLNHFARDAGLPTDMTEASQRLRKGRTTMIDFIELGGLVILNNASLGVYPRLVTKRERLQRRVGKWPAVVFAAFQLITSPLRRHRYELSMNGRTRVVRSPFIFVGNNDYHTEAGGFGGRTNLRSGRMTVAVYQQSSWLGLGKAIWALFRGKRPQGTGLHVNHTQSLTIHRRSKSVKLGHDGEVSNIQPPLEFVLKAGGLKLIV